MTFPQIPEGSGQANYGDSKAPEIPKVKRYRSRSVTNTPLRASKEIGKIAKEAMQQENQDPPLKQTSAPSLVRRVGQRNLGDTSHHLVRRDARKNIGEMQEAPPGEKTVPKSMRYEELNRRYPEGTGAKVVFGDYVMIGIGGQGGKDTSQFAEFNLHGKKVGGLGWKIHLSFDKNHLPDAWNVLFPFLIENGCKHFKVSRLEVQDDKKQSFKEELEAIKTKSGQVSSADQARIQAIKMGLNDIERVTKGMQISIYIPPGEEEEYKTKLNNMEKILSKYNFKPGVIHPKDLKMGNFSSVRHEGKVKYVSYDQASGHNPDQVEDPFN